MIRKANPVETAGTIPTTNGGAKSARTKLTPAELAAQWGKDPGTIIALIRRGELRAIDVSLSTRPRFLIDLADIAIFEQRRAVPVPTPARCAPRPRLKKSDANSISTFF